MCRLEGAEELAASEAGVALVRNRLQGATLVAMPGPRHDPTDPSVAVVIFDTSTSVDINVNKELIHDWCLRSGTFQITQVSSHTKSFFNFNDDEDDLVSRLPMSNTVRPTGLPFNITLHCAHHILPSYLNGIQCPSN